MKTIMAKRCFFVRVFLITLLVGGIIVGWMVYRGITFSLEAEENLHASRFALRVVEEFVRTNGRWPSSWDELQAMKVDKSSPELGGSGYTWPQDWPAKASRLQQHVAIDFHADLQKIASQDRYDFTAIKPIGPYYEYRRYGDVDMLQATIKEKQK